MNKYIIFLILFNLTISCSFNSNSKFWTSTRNIDKENLKSKEIVIEKKRVLNEELNPNLKIKLSPNYNQNFLKNMLSNNNGRVKYNGNLKKISRYKFSRIKNFDKYEPEISFLKNDIIFFDNKGTILRFDENSKLIWKKNYYSKSEKKLNPILQFSNNENILVIADSIAKYYMLDLDTGNLIWSKNNLAPFNSQIKIYKDKFFVIDFLNTLRCFSLKDGTELWNVSTENTLIRSQKKLSIVIIEDKLYFNNSLGDITAVDTKDGQLLWQLPTQSTLIYESAFSLETSDLLADDRSLYFSNNKNQFFSIDLRSGTFNWETTINSITRPTIIDDFLFTISLEGHLIVLQKDNGNIIRITDIFNNFKSKKRSKIKPIGFVTGSKNIYLSTSNGKLLIIDIASGQTISTLKIDNEKISRPLIVNKDMFIIKDNAIIRLN